MKGAIAPSSQQGSYGYWKVFGKLWKLMTPFSRSWKVWKREVFQNSYGKVSLGTF